MKSSRIAQVRAGRCAVLDLRTLSCEMMQGANLSDGLTVRFPTAKESWKACVFVGNLNIWAPVKSH